MEVLDSSDFLESISVVDLWVLKNGRRDESRSRWSNDWHGKLEEAFKERKQSEEEINNKLEGVKFELIPQDASFSEVKLEHFDCRTLKHFSKEKSILEFMMDNAKQIKFLSGQRQ